ncbi:hypothetical protein [Demequina lutea]|uniref:Uncharacterized protein n=1 Tax=Demequina lutea TaxID=431489 RepID=A0A7Y9ZBS8_9MICO|nr:hypothetical protein [Demequina lutea]NYI42477.1 hypothetical protein [Demequina lutea]
MAIGHLDPGSAISPVLWGVLFEAFNSSADRGLYAGVARNRSFDFHDRDDPGWNTVTGWEVSRNVTGTAAPIELRLPISFVPSELTVPTGAERSAGSSCEPAPFSPTVTPWRDELVPPAYAFADARCVSHATATRHALENSSCSTPA